VRPCLKKKERERSREGGRKGKKEGRKEGKYIAWDLLNTVQNVFTHYLT
jgi:hypothetical protein